MNNKLHTSQQGQTIVFSLIFMVIIILSVLMLYNSGKLTSEKMQMQNAADATAYSISLLEARDLNFAAYTNRAMIGNEIAVAQLVGLFSWLDMWGSSVGFFRVQVLQRLQTLAAGTGPAAALFVPVLAALQVILTVIENGLNVVQNGLRSITPIATKVISAVNKAYSLAQQGMHYSTIVLSVSTLSDVIQANAPGAKLSDFGYFSLATHISTYYANPINELTFVRRNKNSNSDELSLFMRHQYAATVNGSRDEFSVNRFSNNRPNGGFDFPLLPFPEIDVNIDIGVAVIDFLFDMGIDLLRRGGTDLRYKEVAGKEEYSWTGVDLMGINFWFLLGLDVDVCVPLIACVDLIDININPSVDIPMGTGAGQVASNAGVMRRGDMINVDGERYGGAPGDLPITYNWTVPTPDLGAVSKMSQASSLIFKGHPGLPEFNAVIPKEQMAKLKADHPGFNFVEDLGFMAPYLVIGLVKEDADIRTIDKILNSNPSRKIHLDNNFQDSEMAAIAKSEVYFSRPTDPLAGHFNRNDGRTEYGSTYNPFWQARLVDTDISERVIALLFQQKQIWALSGVSLTLPFIGTFDLNAQLRRLGLI